MGSRDSSTLSCFTVRSAANSASSAASAAPSRRRRPSSSTASAAADSHAGVAGTAFSAVAGSFSTRQSRVCVPAGLVITVGAAARGSHSSYGDPTAPSARAASPSGRSTTRTDSARASAQIAASSWSSSGQSSCGKASDEASSDAVVVVDEAESVAAGAGGGGGGAGSASSSSSVPSAWIAKRARPGLAAHSTPAPRPVGCSDGPPAFSLPSPRLPRRGDPIGIGLHGGCSAADCAGCSAADCGGTSAPSE